MAGCCCCCYCCLLCALPHNHSHGIFSPACVLATQNRGRRLSLCVRMPTSKHIPAWSDRGPPERSAETAGRPPAPSAQGLAGAADRGPPAAPARGGDAGDGHDRHGAAACQHRGGGEVPRDRAAGAALVLEQALDLDPACAHAPAVHSAVAGLADAVPHEAGTDALSLAPPLAAAEDVARDARVPSAVLRREAVRREAHEMNALPPRVECRHHGPCIVVDNPEPAIEDAPQCIVVALDFEVAEAKVGRPLPLVAGCLLVPQLDHWEVADDVKDLHTESVDA
mmetsp:Transcript_17296/g.54110  ORF Transcript_17296/g.54110 Transcript_17296/m.54110 type:complete len:281 (-) Transcript_17296:589-1431(-)